MNSSVLVDVLKKELKKRSITYKTLGERVGLSEAAVKRLFSEKNFSIKKLDSFCEVIGINYSDLLQAAEFETKSMRQFSEEVESELASDPELLLLLYSVLMGDSPQKIRERVKIDKAKFHRLARRLEAIGLVELLAGDKLRAKVRKSTRWNPKGPLAQRYTQSIFEEFFNTNFQNKFESQDFLTGVLSEASYSIIKNKLAEVFRLFDQLSELDGKLTNEHAKVFWIYYGIRPWSPVAVIERAAKG